MMEYKASAVKHLFWFVEAKETARLLEAHAMEEVREIVLRENLYQQNQESRLKNQFSCIRARLEALPDSLISLLVSGDLRTAKLVNLIGCMASDPLFFDLMYEVYGGKLCYGGENISDGDLHVFFKDKQEENEKISGFSQGAIRKLKQVYSRYMFEAGIIQAKGQERIVAKPYIEPELRQELQNNGMGNYLAALTGEK